MRREAKYLITAGCVAGRCLGVRTFKTKSAETDLGEYSDGAHCCKEDTITG